MSDTVRIGDMIVARSHFRAHLNNLLAKLAAATPRWDRSGFMLRLPRAGVILAAAIYRGPNCHILFVWVCGRQYHWHLGCPARTHTGSGKWSW